MKAKIIIFIGSFNLGGTEKQLFNLLKFIQNDFDIYVQCLQSIGDLEEKILKLNIKIESNNIENKFLRKLNYFFLFFKTFIKITKIKPDIIHFFLPQSYIFGGIYSFFFKKIKFLMSRRSLNFYQKKYFFIKFIEKILHSKMTYILSNSASIKEQLINEENVDPEKVKLIFNGVNIKKFTPKNEKELLKKSLGIKNEIIIICTANIIPYKNHKVLIKSLVKLTKNWKLLLIGKDSNKKYFKELILLSKISGFEKNILFLGHQKNISKFLSISDIGILTSDEEGLSNSILEYLSFKLPVIATDVGGNKEIITHNKNGFLCEKGDYKAISKYLNILITNKKLRNEFGNYGYKIIKNKFSMNKFVDNHKEIYKELFLKK